MPREGKNIMRKFVELRNEGHLNFEDGAFFIDPERIDFFTIRECSEHDDLQAIVFYKGGTSVGCASVFGQKRAEEYALEVMTGKGGE